MNARTRSTTTLLALLLAASVSASASAASHGTDTALGARATWQSPASQEVRSQLLSAIGELNAPETVQNQVEALWPANQSLAGVELLERTAAALAPITDMRATAEYRAEAATVQQKGAEVDQAIETLKDAVK